MGAIDDGRNEGSEVGKCGDFVGFLTIDRDGLSEEECSFVADGIMVGVIGVGVALDEVLYIQSLIICNNVLLFQIASAEIEEKPSLFSCIEASASS